MGKTPFLELLEKVRGDEAGTVNDADDENAVVFREMEDQVVADRKGTEAREEMIDGAAQMRLSGKLGDERR